MMAEPQSFSDFTKFPCLPLEIRNMIWEAAIEPRIVTIRQRELPFTLGEWLRNDGEDDDYHSEADRPGLWKRSKMAAITSDCAPPSTLLACKESYKVASKAYPTKVFDMEAAFPQTYFNFERDTLYVRWDTFIPVKDNALKSNKVPIALRDIQDYEALDKVVNLALLVDHNALPANPEHMNVTLFYGGWLANIIEIFQGLQNLTLVVRHFKNSGHDSEESTLCFMDPIDLEDAFRQFQTRDPESPVIKRLDYIKVDEMLEAYLGRLSWRSGPPHRRGKVLRLPRIDYKICLTEKTKEEYELVKDNYQARIREDRRIR